MDETAAKQGRSGKRLTRKLSEVAEHAVGKDEAQYVSEIRRSEARLREKNRKRQAKNYAKKVGKQQEFVAAITGQKNICQVVSQRTGVPLINGEKRKRTPRAS